MATVSVRGPAALLTAFLLAVSMVPAGASTLTGSTCPKLGAVKNSKGVRYTCIKKSKRLVWNKGVAVIKQTLPTPSPTGDRYAMYGPMGSDYRILDGIARTLSLSTTNQGSPTAASVMAQFPEDPLNAPIATTSVLAVQLFRQLEPKLPDQRVIPYQGTDWVTAKLESLCPIIIPSVKAYGKGNAGCGYLYVLNTDWGRSAGVVNVMGAVGHELFHNAQIAASGGPDDFGRVYPSIPSWFREGSAQVGGGIVYAVAQSKADPSYGGRSWDSPHDEVTCQAALSLWKSFDEPDGHERTNACEGGLGTIMVQMLVARAGSVSPLLDVYRDVAAGKNFRDSVSARFGWKFSDFLDALDIRLKLLGW